MSGRAGKRVKKALGWLGLGLLVVVVGLAFNIGRVAEYAMTPKVPFSAETPPPAPDYADPANWSALPERQDSADLVPAGESPIDQRGAQVDVFYVHPTSYVGSRWNGPTLDAELNAATDKVATGIQASAFNACCAVYAPRYRQANGTAFYNPRPDGQRAIDLAYADVRRAFDAFNARRGADRPFILASHSQGSMMLERLLYETVSRTPLRDRLVAAYLIGGHITVDGLRERAPDIAPCRARDDLHCVVSWTARGPTYVQGRYDIYYPDRRELVCTNPLTWLPDGAHADASRNLGAVFLETEDRSARRAFADARCSNSRLVVSQIGKSPRDLPSRILDHVMGAENYHPIEFQIFFMNLRQNARERAAAFARR